MNQCTDSVVPASNSLAHFGNVQGCAHVLCQPYSLISQGWISVRRELRLPMLVFLVMSAGYLGGWGAMFKAPSFRWTFVLWRFFSVITSTSVFLTMLTFFIGVWCRLNFGKGLSRYCESFFYGMSGDA